MTNEKEKIYAEYIVNDYRLRIGASTIFHNEVTDWDGIKHYCKTIDTAFNMFCKINDIKS